jgi:hypothetical protein
MKKLLTTSLVTMIGLAVLVSPFVAYGACNWILFGAQNKCQDESCGIGCEIEEYGPVVKYCSNGSVQNECCECWSQIITCDCIFGPGYGLETSRLTKQQHQCNLVDPMGPMPGPGECIAIN